MIFNVMRTAAMNLRRDRAALVLNFILPVVFFSIFAGIFAGMGRRDSMPKVQVVLADLDHSALSMQLVAALQRETALHLILRPDVKPNAGATAEASPFDAAAAEALVRKGKVPVALVIPSGFGASLQGQASENAGGTPARPASLPLQLLADSSDPISPQVVNGLLQKAAMTSMPSLSAGMGMRYMDRWVGGLSPQQRSRMEENMSRLQTLPPAPASHDESDLIQVKTRDVTGENKKNPGVAFYAAGIGVMFLLFTAANAGGALLEESESGTLDRILSTRVSMMQLLLGKLAFLTCLGTAQLIVMFVWGAVAFKLELWSHLPGFLVMTITTALAASAFGLLLASLARTRPQLGALSTLLILSMSALGGSMFPRFLMPPVMRKVGMITFNAWAIDGYIKVFWLEEPIVALWPQVLVLGTAAIVFFFIARQMARRWEFS